MKKLLIFILIVLALTIFVKAKVFADPSDDVISTQSVRSPYSVEVSK